MIRLSPRSVRVPSLLTGAVLLGLAGPAAAQDAEGTDDVLLGATLSDPPDDTGTEAPAPAEADAAPSLAPAPLPRAADGVPVAVEAPLPELADLPSAPRAAAAPLVVDYAGGNALAGVRIQPFDPGTGASVGLQAVVGGNGGTDVMTVTARHRVDDLVLSVSLPYAAHRTPAGRDLGLGNLGFGISRLMPGQRMEQRVGVELTAGLLDRTYTWANDPVQVWPSWGGALVWQGQMQKDAVTWLFRGDAGVYKVAPYDPYPNAVVRLHGAAAVDWAFAGDRAGLVGETSISYWDTSPWELSGLVRVDPVAGMRVRAGLVLPLAVWAGWTPADLRGARETTLIADLSLAF